MLQKMHKYREFAGLHIPDHVFEDIYTTSSDPYGYTHRDYERQKRSATLAALSRDHSRAQQVDRIVAEMAAAFHTSLVQSKSSS